MFVDETKSRGLLLTAAAVLPGDLQTARSEMRSLLRSGQRRLHFAKEQDGRRKKILDVIDELGPEVVLYDGSRHAHHQQRRACLEAMMVDLSANGTRMLVLELDDSVVRHDEQVLYEQKRRLACVDLRFEHLRAHAEPLLAIPDAVAWCWQRGSHWKTRVQNLVVEVRIA